MLKKYPTYKYILAFGDFSLLLISFALAVWLRFFDLSISEIIKTSFLVSQSLFIIISSLIWIFIFQHFHLYKINIFLSSIDQIIAVIKALAYGLIGIIVSSYLIKGLNWTDSRIVIFYFSCFTFVFIAVFRIFIFRKLFVFAAQKKIICRRVLIVGADQTAKDITVQVALDDSHGFEVIGFVDDDLPVNTHVFQDLKVIGKIDNFKELVKSFKIDDIIIAQSDVSHQKLLEIIDQAGQTQAQVRLASELYNIIPEKVLVERFVGTPILLIGQNSDSILFNVYKRAFDLVVSVAALIILAVPLLVIAVVIMFTSKGGVLYSHIRIGKNGDAFKFYKFRTMYVNNDDKTHQEFIESYIKQRDGQETHKIKKITDDPRVTRIGKFLRKTSLDELPQIFNVLQGKMSLVGPRPCLPYEWNLYEDWHRRRLSVIPGCTGLWQISGRSTVDFNDMVILDLFYINNMSPLFDLKILFKTIPVMFFGKGGY